MFQPAIMEIELDDRVKHVKTTEGEIKNNIESNLVE